MIWGNNHVGENYFDFVSGICRGEDVSSGRYILLDHFAPYVGFVRINFVLIHYNSLDSYRTK